MSAKNYGSPRWTGEIADCSMPMTFDQYSNCGFSCAYCFSQYQRAVGQQKLEYVARVARAVDVEKVKRIFTDPDSSQFGPYVRARKVMQWGGLSDPFCPIERARGVGLQLLRFFREIEYPICFSTKGVWWLRDERYRRLFAGAKFWNCKFSIITLDERKSRLVERGAPSPTARLAAIADYSALGAGGATLRLRPFILGVSNPTHIELIARAGAAGADAVSTEFFCLETRAPRSGVFRDVNLPLLNEAAVFDVWQFYRRHSRAAGYLRLDRSTKRRYIDEMEQAARAAGMRFYVSDAHFKERCDNGSCCGLSPDWNYSRGQFCEALVQCRARGCVRWTDIGPAADDFLGAVPYTRACGFNTNSAEKVAAFQRHSLLSYLRWLWNNPRAGQSPYRLFGGVMRPGGLDDNGDIVYYYDSTKA